MLHLYTQAGVSCPGHAELRARTLLTRTFRVCTCVYRLESVALVMQNCMLEDMLDNEEQLTEQLDALPYLVWQSFIAVELMSAACMTGWMLIL